MEQALDVEWIDNKRWPQEKPDPNYPFGIDLDVSKGAKEACKAKLPYPAKRCGFYLITCRKCGLRVGVTTAGRSDDPRSVTIPCRMNGDVIDRETGEIVR